MVVTKIKAGHGIDGDVNVGPAVIVEVVGDGRDRVVRARFQDSRFFGDIGKRAVALLRKSWFVPGGRPRGPHISGKPIHWQVPSPAAGIFARSNSTKLATKRSSQPSRS